MPALKRKTYLFISLYTNTRHRSGGLSLKCFDDISCPGMLSQTVDPAKPTAHASLFSYVNLLHLVPLSIWYTATACRIPY